MHLWWCQESQFSLSNGIYHVFFYGVTWFLCSNSRSITAYNPLPLINKLFALISQEEEQRKIGIQSNSSSDSASRLACAVKNDNTKKFADNFATYKSKNRHFCTHCNFHDHTIEKCYKVHGYPPGFKPRSRDNLIYSNSYNTVKQISYQSYSNSNGRNDQQGSIGNFVLNFGTNQY